MFSRPTEASGSMRRPGFDEDLEELTEILRVGRRFMCALADDECFAEFIASESVGATYPEPIEVTAAFVRQSLGLTPRAARLIVPAGRASVFDTGMWTVSFVDAVTAARGGGPGLVLYVAASRSGWQVLPGELHGPRVLRQISFPTGWPEANPDGPAG